MAKVTRKEYGQAAATIVSPKATKKQKDDAAATIQQYINENPGEVG